MDARQQPRDVQQVVFAALASIGGLCLLVGVALVLFLGYVIYLAFESPKEIALLAHFMELAGARMLAFSGNLDGRTFEVVLGEPLYWIALILVGSILLGVVGGIAKALIKTGGELLRSRSEPGN